MNRRDILKYSAILLGSTASLSVSKALLAETISTPGFRATVFNVEQAKIVELLSEMIIPTTDTPGAVAAGVPDFIATIVSEWYTETERSVFFNGLHQLDKYCQQQSNTQFSDSSAEVRIAALTEQERIANDYKAPPSGFFSDKQAVDEKSPFFRKIKELVVLGYYTSEVGSQQELAYRPVPGEYNGDYEFAKVGRQWSY